MDYLRAGHGKSGADRLFATIANMASTSDYFNHLYVFLFLFSILPNLSFMFSMLRDIINKIPNTQCTIFWKPDFLKWREMQHQIYRHDIPNIKNFGVFMGIKSTGFKELNHYIRFVSNKRGGHYYTKLSSHNIFNCIT